MDPDIANLIMLAWETVPYSSRQKTKVTYISISHTLF